MCCWIQIINIMLKIVVYMIYINIISDINL